jgi:hypothetical protein
MYNYLQDKAHLAFCIKTNLLKHPLELIRRCALQLVILMNHGGFYDYLSKLGASRT